LATGLLDAVGQQCTKPGPPTFSWKTFGLENIPKESYLTRDPK